MKGIVHIFYIIVLSILLIGCGDNSAEQPTSELDPEKNESISQSNDEDLADDHEQKSRDKSTDEAKEQNSASTGDSSPENGSENSTVHGEDSLSSYASDQVEYARIWKQLGPNQVIDELNVHFIAAGELVNPNDDTSASYPEDVIQLSGSRLVDGSITYSSNGDGTINVYHVPLRWESPAEAEGNYMKEYTEKLIENTDLVYVDPDNDDDIINLIKKLHID